MEDEEFHTVTRLIDMALGAIKWAIFLIISFAIVIFIIVAMTN